MSCPKNPKSVRSITAIIALLLIFICSTPAFAQKADSSKMSSLMVYGDGFMFSVKEPQGWKGDIDNAAEYHANIILYTSMASVKKGGALIQIYIFDKKDENTIGDLQYDIDSYKGENKDLKQEDLIVSHKEYKCFSKLVYVENKFYQYLVYVNPGAKYKTGLSVAMNISKRPATEKELQAFKEVAASLLMF